MSTVEKVAYLVRISYRMVANINKIYLTTLTCFKYWMQSIDLNIFLTTCYFFVSYSLNYLGFRQVDKKFTAVPYFLEGNSLLFLPQRSHWRFTIYLSGILMFSAGSRIIVSGIYCFNKSILSKNSWTCICFMSEQHHPIL